MYSHTKFVIPIIYYWRYAPDKLFSKLRSKVKVTAIEQLVNGTQQSVIQRCTHILNLQFLGHLLLEICSGKEIYKIWPSDLLFLSNMTQFQFHARYYHYKQFDKSASKIDWKCHFYCVKKYFLRFDLVTYFFIQHDPVSIPCKIYSR